MKGGLGWQMGRRRVADTDAVSRAEEVGRADSAECVDGTKDKAVVKGCGVIRAIL